ncbi:MAG: DUF2155 domain-containing protein [Pseudomonadota bacterium]
MIATRAVLTLWLCFGLVLTLPAEAQTTDTEENEAAPERRSRFQRAPFRTYNDLVGPRRPREIARPETQSQPGARLRQLDKMTGEIETFDLITTNELEVGRLRVRVDACRTSDDTSLGGAIALVKIWDLRKASLEPDFSGWMFAESPALSAFDHPRYDVWVINCITASGELDTGSE